MVMVSSAVAGMGLTLTPLSTVLVRVLLFSVAMVFLATKPASFFLKGL
jgi:hypothetical protein